jgi:hypothetical protein
LQDRPAQTSRCSEQQPPHSEHARECRFIQSYRQGPRPQRSCLNSEVKRAFPPDLVRMFASQEKAKQPPRHLRHKLEALGCRC